MGQGLRIAHVVPSMDVSMGGPPVAVVGWVRGLRDIGDSSVIVTTSLAGPAGWRNRAGPSPSMPAGSDGLDIRIVPIGHPGRIAYAPRFRDVLDGALRDVDIVHVHMLYLYPGFAAHRAARQLGLPVVVSPHGALDPYILAHSRMQKRVADRVWQRRALDEAAAIIVVTPEEGAALAPVGIRAPVVTARLGLDLDAFRLAGAARRHLGPPILLNHGRLAPKKSLELLIDALPLVLARRPETILRIIGPDPAGLGPRLMARARRLEVEQAMRIDGPLYGADLARAVASATAWLLPSAQENFGIAVVEAMAAGVPVVISAEVDLAAEAVSAGACLIVPREPTAIAAAAIDLLGDPAACNALSRAGEAYAAGFTLVAAARELHHAYIAAIEGRSSRS